MNKAPQTPAQIE
jgi:hypothetical protein